MLKHCKKFKSFFLFPSSSLRPSIVTVFNRPFTYATNAGERRQKGFHEKYLEQTYINPLHYQIKMTSEDLLRTMRQNKTPSVDIQPNLQWNGFKEGKAVILNAKYKKEGSDLTKLDEIHYNQSEIFERDITILVLQEYLNLRQKNSSQEGSINILNAIGGSGMKSFRMLKELNLNVIKSITTTDTIKTTPEFIQINNIINRLNPEQISKHKVFIGDPGKVLYQPISETSKDSKNHKYHVIDINAQGSPLPYIESAIEALEENGLLCLTFTDIKVLSGPDFEKAYYYYGSTRSKSTVKHEQGIRIALSAINSIANKSDKYITPILSFFDSFYFRLYMVVNHSKQESKKSVVKTGNVCVCSKCPNYTVIPLGKEVVSPNGEKAYIPIQTPVATENCEICDSPNLLDGPIWISPINDYEFVRRMYMNLSSMSESDARNQFLTFAKLSALLFNVVKEKDVGNNPLALSFSHIAAFLNMKAIPKKDFIKNSLRNQGYGMVRSYIFKDLWKSDANMRVAFDFMKVWRKRVLHPKDYFGEFSPDSPQYKALEKPIRHFKNFGEGIDLKKESEAAEINKESNSLFDAIEEMPLSFKNPSSEWGPKKLPKKPKGENTQ